MLPAAERLEMKIPARTGVIPKRALCRNGKVVDTSGEIWVLPEESVDMQINWNLLPGAPHIKNSMKAFVFYKVESQAPQSSWTVFNSLKYFAEEIKHVDYVSDLSFTEFQKYLNKLRPKNHEWLFGHVRRWYEWCFRQEITGFNGDLLGRLKKLNVKTLVTGQSVLNRDPKKGPLTDEEFRLVRQAVKDKKGSLTERVLVMLLLELGVRPAQVVLINESDFKVFRKSDGKEEFYSIQVSRIKQGVVGAREKKPRRISAELGQQISLLIEENKRLYPGNGTDRPLLFSQTKKTYESTAEKAHKNSNRTVRRMTRPMVRYYVQNYPLEANIISSQTGEILDLHPYRLRYTFGTRHANQGTPAAVIAEMLDHSSLESVRIYTKGTNAMVQYLNEALGKNEQFTGVMDLFMGEVRPETAKEAANKTIEGTVPTLKNLGGIGVCGASFLCNLYPPLSCYVCPKFTAWKDGPHEEMLVELEDYVKRASAKFNNPSDRIPQQLKNTILAIKSLLNKIGEMKDE